jgi:tRNA(fMet)-specific endonuclease VapC
MTVLLLDTDVVSFLLKGDSRSQKYEPIIQGHQLALSFMTVAELFQWAAVRNWGTQRIGSLERSLDSYLIHNAKDFQNIPKLQVLTVQ